MSLCGAQRGAFEPGLCLEQFRAGNGKSDQQFPTGFLGLLSPVVYRGGGRNEHSRDQSRRHGEGEHTTLLLYRNPGQYLGRKIRRRRFAAQRLPQFAFKVHTENTSCFCNLPRNNASERCRWLFTVLKGISRISAISVGSRSS